MRNLYFSFFVFIFQLSAHAQTINFIDPVFKARLLEADVTNNIAQGSDLQNIKIDANGDGEIQTSEALLVYRLFYTPNPPIRPAAQTMTSVSRAATPNLITGVTELPYFVNLRNLDLSDQQIAVIDLSGLTQLQSFACRNSGVQSLVINTTSGLLYLDCAQNALTELDLQSHFQLQTVYCENNQLTQLAPVGLTNLQYLSCHHNALTSILFGDNPNLTFVYCGQNQLSQIDLNGTTTAVIHCEDNPMLTTIKTQNGVDSPYTFIQFPAPPMDAFNFNNLPLLQNVCGDEGEVAVLEQFFAAQPSVNVSECALGVAGFFEDFDANFALPAGWLVSDNGVGTQYGWAIDNIFMGQSDPNWMLCQREIIGAGNTSEDWLMTPPIALSAQAALRFYTGQILNGNDGTLYHIKLSTGAQADQSGYVNLATFDEQLTYANNAMVIHPIDLDLGAYSGQTVHLAFVREYTQTGAAIGGDRWIIDDVWIENGVLATESFAPSESFALYPNPAKDRVTVKWNPNQPAKQIALYDALGRCLRVQQDEVIELSGLPSGLYLVKVTTARGSETKKLLKQ